MALNGLTVSYAGLNLQSPLGANSGANADVNALIGSNIYWNTNSSNYTLNNNGGAGYSALWGYIYGGMGISTSNATQPGSVTNSQFLTNTALFVNEYGRTILGDPGSGGAFSATDNGNTLQVNGTMWQPQHSPADNAACTPGQFADDANYHYACTSTNTWKRVALSSY